jgi:hypothetical protein
MQLIEQGPGFFQIERVEALGETGVDRGEEVGSLLPFAALGGQARKIACRAEFE